MPDHRHAADLASLEQNRHAFGRRVLFDHHEAGGHDVAGAAAIGDKLRSRTDGRQEAEVAVAASALNRMLDLGRPEYVRIA